MFSFLKALIQMHNPWFSLLCDEDGFSLQLNSDPSYPHVLHVLPMENITHLLVSGGISLRSDLIYHSPV